MTSLLSRQQIPYSNNNFVIQATSLTIKITTLLSRQEFSCFKQHLSCLYKTFLPQSRNFLSRITLSLSRGFLSCEEKGQARKNKKSLGRERKLLFKTRYFFCFQENCCLKKDIS
jgi:hypothetical protein